MVVKEYRLRIRQMFIINKSKEKIGEESTRIRLRVGEDGKVAMRAENS